MAISGVTTENNNIILPDGKQLKGSDNRLKYNNAELAFFGERGPQGKKGIDGIAGVKGKTGIDGEIGDVGAKGLIGETGVTGDVGIQGEKGDVGDQGPKGDTGFEGFEGPQGPKGLGGKNSYMFKMWRCLWTGSMTAGNTMNTPYSVFNYLGSDNLTYYTSELMVMGRPSGSNAKTSITTSIMPVYVLRPDSYTTVYAALDINAATKVNKAMGYNIVHIPLQDGLENSYQVYVVFSKNPQTSDEVFGVLGEDNGELIALFTKAGFTSEDGFTFG